MDTKNLISKLEDIDKRINSLLPKDIIKLTPINFLIASIFNSCISYYKSIILLLKANMQQEAMIILRTLMIASLRLSYLAKKPEDRISLICRMAQQENYKWLKITEQAYEIGIESNLDEIKNIVKNREKEIINFLKKTGNKKKRFPSEKQIASQLDKKEAYMNYQILSQSVHNSIYSNLSRVKTKDSFKYFTLSKENYIDSYAITTESLEWILNACVAVGLMLNIDKLSKLGELGKNGEDVFKNIDSLQ